MRGRTVVITGGARGIGRACVERFAGAGANVVAVDIAAPAGADVTPAGVRWVVDVKYRADSSLADSQRVASLQPAPVHAAKAARRVSASTSEYFRDVDSAGKRRIKKSAG